MCTSFLIRALFFFKLRAKSPFFSIAGAFLAIMLANFAPIYFFKHFFERFCHFSVPPIIFFGAKRPRRFALAYILHAATGMSRPRRRRACLGLDRTGAECYPRAKRGAARRLRRRAGIPPSAGASAPERASRPEGEGRAGQGEPARGGQARGRPSSSARGSAGAGSHTKLVFCMTYLPYKIPTSFV